MVKKALSQVSVYHSNGHLVKLYSTKLNLFYGKYSFALHNLWLLPNISSNFSILNKITFILLDVDLMCKERMLSFICCTMILQVILVGHRVVKGVPYNSFVVNNAYKQYKCALKCLFV